MELRVSEFRTVFFAYFQKELRGNYDVVMAAVSGDGTALYHASDELKGNPEIVITAVMHNWRALIFASEELKANCNIAMAAVSQNCQALLFTSQEPEKGHLGKGSQRTLPY